MQQELFIGHSWINWLFNVIITSWWNRMWCQTGPVSWSSRSWLFNEPRSPLLLWSMVSRLCDRIWQASSSLVGQNLFLNVSFSSWRSSVWVSVFESSSWSHCSVWALTVNIFVLFWWKINQDIIHQLSHHPLPAQVTSRRGAGFICQVTRWACSNQSDAPFKHLMRQNLVKSNYFTNWTWSNLITSSINVFWKIFY